MRFSILHPTARVDREFQHAWWHACFSASAGCVSPKDVQYIIVVHHSREDDFYFNASYALEDNYVLVDAMRGWGQFDVVINYGRDCLVDQCNAGYLAVRGEIVIGNQDDMRFPPNWDEDIRHMIPDTSQLVCVHARTDGPRGDLLTIPTIATKVLIDEIGPLSPEYDGMFSDDEWSIKARKIARVIPSNLHFEHLNPHVREDVKGDSVHAMENRKEAYEIGRRVFLERMAMGFPRVEGVPGWPSKREPAASEPTPITPGRPAQRVISLCTPGESHDFNWERDYMGVVFSLLSQGWIVRCHFGYTTNVYGTRIDLANQVMSEKEQVDGGAPEYVLWIDDDNLPSVEAVNELLFTLESREDIAVAAGWCWIRSADDSGKIVWMPSCGNFKPGTMYLLPTGLKELYADNASPKLIEWTGFPTLLMRYSALVKLGAKSFVPILAEETRYGFSGEDTAFCARAKEAGLSIVVCPRAKVAHLKTLEAEPDYTIGPKANPERAAIVESDRERRKGERVEITEEVKTLMEAAM